MDRSPTSTGIKGCHIGQNRKDGGFFVSSVPFTGTCDSGGHSGIGHWSFIQIFVSCLER